MKLYVAWIGEFSDREVVGIYSSLEAAVTAAKAAKRHYYEVREVESYELDGGGGDLEWDNEAT